MLKPGPSFLHIYGRLIFESLQSKNNMFETGDRQKQVLTCFFNVFEQVLYINKTLCTNTYSVLWKLIYYIVYMFSNNQVKYLKTVTIESSEQEITQFSKSQEPTLNCCVQSIFYLDGLISNKRPLTSAWINISMRRSKQLTFQ